jgi:heme-degrading monooxygenase HmoA
MIARTWHGVVPIEKADAYHAYLFRTGVPDLRATPGNLGVHVLRRGEATHAHFFMISWWASREAIRAFAGQDVERARYYPEDAAYLVELEPNVTHYDVLEDPDRSIEAAP